MNYGDKRENVSSSNDHSGLPCGALLLLSSKARDQLAANSSPSRSEVSFQGALSEVIKILKLPVKCVV